MIQTDFINFLKPAVLPKRAWLGYDTSVGRVGLLVNIKGHIILFCNSNL